MDVSIIYVNYNTTDLLVDSIRSVIEKTVQVKYDIYVVDNNSTINPKKRLNEEFGDIVNCIDLEENIGFGRANNVAMRLSDSKYFFLLNPDTKLLNNAIDILYSYILDNKKVAVCGGNLFYENLQPAHSFKRNFPSVLMELNILSSNNIFRLLYGRSLEFNFTNKEMNVAYITGADMFVDAEVIRSVGYFDEDFFMYYEETELSYRIKKANYRLVSIPEAKIMHFESVTMKSNFIKQQRIFVGRNLFFKKTHSKIYKLFADVIFLTNSIVRYLVFSVLNNREKMGFWKNYMKIAFNSL